MDQSRNLVNEVRDLRGTLDKLRDAVEWKYSPHRIGALKRFLIGCIWMPLWERTARLRSRIWGDKVINQDMRMYEWAYLRHRWLPNNYSSSWRSLVGGVFISAEPTLDNLDRPWARLFIGGVTSDGIDQIAANEAVTLRGFALPEFPQEPANELLFNSEGKEIAVRVDLHCMYERDEDLALVSQRYFVAKVMRIRELFVERGGLEFEVELEIQDRIVRINGINAEARLAKALARLKGCSGKSVEIEPKKAPA